MKQDLPPSLIIHTLEPWGENIKLLRLEHIFGPDDDPELSQPVTVNLEVNILIYKENIALFLT